MLQPFGIDQKLGLIGRKGEQVHITNSFLLFVLHTASEFPEKLLFDLSSRQDCVPAILLACLRE